MRIGMDGLALTGEREGAAQYTRHLVYELATLEHEIVIFVPEHDIEVASRRLAEVRVKIQSVNFPAKFADNFQKDKSWYGNALPDALGKHNLDVFHGTSFIVPESEMLPMVATIHDLIFLKHPSLSLPEDRERYEFFDRDSVERSDAVLCVSETTKKDLESLWPNSDQPRIVSRLGAAFSMPREPEEYSREIVRRALGINSHYVLMVTPNHARKNLDAALRVHAALPEDMRVAYPLVVLNGDKSDELQKRADFIDPCQVISTGWVDDTVMTHVLRCARAVLMPTLAEGFGMPALDAMTIGAPLVGSNRPALPEIVDGAFPLFDPNDVTGMAGYLEKLLTDDNFYMEARQAGFSRSSLFSWRTCVESTLEAYEEAITRFRYRTIHQQ